jgi:hypothetical protein
MRGDEAISYFVYNEIKGEQQTYIVEFSGHILRQDRWADSMLTPILRSSGLLLWYIDRKELEERGTRLPTQFILGSSNTHEAREAKWKLF